MIAPRRRAATGLPLDGPDPECVLGHGESLLGLLEPRVVPAPRRFGRRHSGERVTSSRRPPTVTNANT